jgi:hypothetical protein
VFLYIDVSGIVLSPAARLPPHADLDLPLSPSQEAGARLVERLAGRQRAFSLTASDACLALLLGRSSPSRGLRSVCPLEGGCRTSAKARQRDHALDVSETTRRC